MSCQNVFVFPSSSSTPSTSSHLPPALLMQATQIFIIYMPFLSQSFHPAYCALYTVYTLNTFFFLFCLMLFLAHDDK